MSRNAITRRYLEEVGRLGMGADELPSIARSSIDLHATSYEGRCLSRPVFLDYSERAELSLDVGRLVDALTKLPERLFGGDLGAFARTAGLTNAQVNAVVRGTAKAPTKLARADLYHDGRYFRIMEVNMGSSLGGLDNVLIIRAFLTHPVVARFLETHRLTYVDTMAELVDTLLTESGFTRDEHPLVAIADWPESYQTLEPQLRYSAAALAKYGIEAVPCHVGQLEVAQGKVWLDGRPVDIIYRLFMIEDLLDPTGPALIEPILQAVERGEVAIFAPMDAELYGSKAALALLSDEANRHLFDEGELESIDRILPWTRMVRPGHVTVDGGSVDLREFAIEQRQELALKPTALHGGSGVVLGWQVGEDEWRSHLDNALGGPYVVQRRIRAVPEDFPSAAGLRPWILAWGVFSVSRGYGGTYVRGSTDLAGGVVNVAAGATATCCFHEETGWGR